jgi:hypothetical protein
MTTPTITLNGTSRDALVSQRLNVMESLRDVLERMQEAAPNGRDYAGESFKRAVAEHSARRSRSTWSRVKCGICALP